MCRRCRSRRETYSPCRSVALTAMWEASPIQQCSSSARILPKLGAEPPRLGPIETTLGSNDDTIVTRCAVARHVAVTDVTRDQFRIAVEGIAVAAAATRLQDHDVLAPHGQVVGLERREGPAAANLVVRTDRVAA